MRRLSRSDKAFFEFLIDTRKYMLEVEERDNHMKPTGGEWRKGRDGQSIVSDCNDGLFPADSEVVSHYGGYLICESIASCNQPVVSASKELFEACKNAMLAHEGELAGGGQVHTDGDELRAALTKAGWEE